MLVRWLSVISRCMACLWHESKAGCLEHRQCACVCIAWQESVAARVVSIVLVSNEISLPAANKQGEHTSAYSLLV